MEAESEVEFSSSDVKFIPSWRRSATLPPQREGLYYSRSPRPRPQSYQSPSGLLVTDFPVEDRHSFTLTQPDERITSSPESKISHQRAVFPTAPNGKLLPSSSSSSSLEYKPLAQNHKRSSQVLKVVSNNAISFTANGNLPSPNQKSMVSNRISSSVTVTPDKEQIIFGSNSYFTKNGLEKSGNCDQTLQTQAKQDVNSFSPDSSSGSSKSPSDEKQALQRIPSNSGSLSEKQSVVLSTNSAAALRMGAQQIIPKSLASEIKVTNKTSGSQNMEPNRRLLKTRSMVETNSARLVAASDDGKAEPETDSPGTLRRGLRSTSYRRAVVSGIDTNSPTERKKNNRMSQPNLKAVVEDKERFSSLGRIKRKILRGQGTFDGEENAVLYQNYKEKALEIDSDEEADAKEQKEERIIVEYKPLRSTWSQLSVVRKNGLSQSVSQEERKRQEAMFEVISSEHSYLLSLEILIRMFKNSKQLSSTMTKTESHHLFSNITDVCEASKKFFKELEGRHQRNIVIEDISDIVEKHAKSTFDPYVKYCTNEVYQQRTLQKLISTNASFKEVLSRIESHEDCRNLPMISFLILPMQRVTRLPLLMDTICQKTPKDSSKYEVCKRALKEVGKLVRLCNEGARKMERMEMMVTINSQLEFKIKPFPLVSSSRWLMKRGELTAYVEDTGIFSKKTTKQPVYFFLFNDVLIITKKKSEESYNVTDYSLLEQLYVEQYDSEEPTSPTKTSTPILYLRQCSASHLFTLTIRSNYAGEEVEMLLGAETLSDRARWITALGQRNDRPYTDRTTLTQVEITRTYTAKQPDELSLQVADVVLVYQKINDGWYEGERLRDGERGWFPMECAKEITCRATIEKNMERMGRLLALETNV
ncbi:rho guanine nucleotide exchange factor 26 [Spea bombifrons]|uniref:rho guanine nucleotide exchange factor 26 n=1 Tax=Spea bombifrons TaxID=233779 RepID=UPI00234B8D3D|nr:rho guanine nucleotide exchange factor 26 [Spea bombifrons]XP_053314931.1 rho guanine nucleotide exchange factor 26 [Spea bombifrons]XP_053314932.1 rho guanine nucleotide exchange factor 26 [Spea bombifrons]